MDEYLSFENIPDPDALKFREARYDALSIIRKVIDDGDIIQMRTSKTIIPPARRLGEWIALFDKNMRSTEMRLPEATRARVCYAETGMRLTLGLFEAARKEITFLEAYRLQAQEDYDKQMSIISIDEVPLKKGDRKRGVVEEDLPYESKYAIKRRKRRDFAARLIRLLEELLRRLSLKGSFMMWWLKKVVINVPDEYKSFMTSLTQENVYFLKYYTDPTSVNVD